MRAWRLPDGLHRVAHHGVRGAVHRRLARRGKTGLRAGISRPWNPGWPAGECAIAALENGGPDDFTNYAQRMEAAWGKEYRRGRYFHKLAGNPKVANAGIKLIDNARFRDADAAAVHVQKLKARNTSTDGAQNPGAADRQLGALAVTRFTGFASPS